LDYPPEHPPLVVKSRPSAANMRGAAVEDFAGSLFYP